jgi:hypothetical protein
MAIPAQIRKQSEAVAKLYEELNPTDEGQSSAEGEVQQPTEADGGGDAAAAPVPTGQGQPGNTDEDLTYEQRWRSLQGMYNAETARLKAENNQMGQRVSQLERLIASLSAPQQAPAQVAAAKLITDKDVEDYGDSIEVMRRAAREEVAAAQQEVAELKRMVMQMQTTVVPKVESVAQRQALNSEQMFWSELSAEVPDWREINAEQGFHNWLLEVDPLSGVARQSYLDNAQNQLDARRVAGFFKTWQSMNSGSVAQSPRSVASSQLEKQISPGRGRTSASSMTANEAKAYNRADVAKFFDDVRKGLYKGREQERDRIERDIFAAQREGRIT